jgi:LysR family transcriptional regulator, glycine cleavage system transcriptional activator
VDLLIAVEPAVLTPSQTVPLFLEQLGPVLASALATKLALRSPTDVADKVLLQSKGRLNAWSMWAAQCQVRRIL